MSTAPVNVIAWLDPPLQTDFVVGDSVRWHASFVDPVSRVAVDPDIVIFTTTTPLQVSTPLTYGNSAVVKDSVGNYHLDVALTIQGKWLLNALAYGNPGAVGIGSTQMRLGAYASGQ